ncbi:restriction endonuclease subunit S, partial [Psittacicella gerlachiana]
MSDKTLQSQIPTLRFPKYKEEWITNTVGNIFTQITRGKVLSTKRIQDKKDTKYQYPVYSSQTLNDGIIGYYDEYLFENSITWTTDGAGAGNVNFRENRFFCTNVCGVLISENGLCNLTIAEIINQVAYKYVSPVGIPKLMNNVMSTVVITYPPTIEEQLKIGHFFKDLD